MSLTRRSFLAAAAASASAAARRPTVVMLMTDDHVAWAAGLRLSRRWTDMPRRNHKAVSFA